jgi:hypothetical protein
LDRNSDKKRKNPRRWGRNLRRLRGKGLALALNALYETFPRERNPPRRVILGFFGNFFEGQGEEVQNDVGINLTFAFLPEHLAGKLFWHW